MPRPGWQCRRALLRAAAVLCAGALCARGQPGGQCADMNGVASCARHLTAYASRGGCSHVPVSADEIANFAAGRNLSYYCRDSCGGCPGPTPAPVSATPSASTTHAPTGVPCCAPPLAAVVATATACKCPTYVRRRGPCRRLRTELPRGAGCRSKPRLLLAPKRGAAQVFISFYINKGMARALPHE